MSTYLKSELMKLSTTRGVLFMLSSDPPDVKNALIQLKYLEQLEQLQTELIKMQNWVVAHNQRVMVIFEGGEFAGKGSAMRAITAHLNPRSVRTVALPKPSPEEAGQWYFQRYTTRLPQAGEIVLFDRSWYNRAVVEPVNGFCTKKVYQQFMGVVNEFERMIYQDGIIIIKIFLTISKQVQAQRIKQVLDNPLRRWEFSKVDKNAQKLWDKYIQYQKRMFEETNTKHVPWEIINSNDKLKSNIEVINHILERVPWNH